MLVVMTRHQTSSLFRFIDLFAGIGGLRIPFDELGGRCVFTSEIDRAARSTYQQNFGFEDIDEDIVLCDKSMIPEHELLLAGFPCQPFSQAGLREGFGDPTRGTMFFEIMEVIRFHEPAVVLLENVKGLTHHDRGRTMSVIERMLDSPADDAPGYWVRAKVLNAFDFGLPQNRERIYIVALRKDLFRSSDFDFPEPPRDETRVGSILEHAPDPSFTISDRLWAGHQRRRATHQAKGNGFGFGMFGPDDPYTYTLLARYYKDGREILIDQGPDRNPRKITPREAARLQGFPEDFVVHPSRSQAYRQFGNAVPVPVVRAIAERLVPLMRKRLRSVHMS